MPRREGASDFEQGAVPPPRPLARSKQAGRTMGHRTFIDADGVVWQVWDVYPQLAERRRGPRRVPPSRLGPNGRDQRTGIDRRRRAEVRVPVRQGYEHGWLTFDSVVGSKRLAPIPDGWDSLPEHSLLELWRRGKDAARIRRRLIE
jgi:hypothetical protein